LVVFAPLCTHLNCSRDSGGIFLERVAGLYLSNPYHGAIHAAQVCHLGSWLIKSIGLVDKQTAIEHAAFVIAALCHDVKHFGRNNAFCVNTENVLALRYNNAKVLESMHAATCLELLQDMKMLSSLPWTDRLAARSNIIEYILATDMAEHFEGISKFRLRLEAPDFGLGVEADRRFAARMCLKAGDIGHSALPWGQHTEWSIRVAEEFFAQGDEEKTLGLPISALCDRAGVDDFAKSQKGFLNFVCTPLFEALSACHLQLEQRRERSDTVASNLDETDDLTSPKSEPAVPELPKRRKSSRRFSFKDLGLVQKSVQGVCIPLLKTNSERWTDDHATVENVLDRLKRSKLPARTSEIIHEGGGRERCIT